MIAIVDYKAGNLTSVARALEHLGHRCEITDHPERVRAGFADGPPPSVPSPVPTEDRLVRLYEIC